MILLQRQAISKVHYLFKKLNRLNNWLCNRREIKYRPGQSNYYLYYQGRQIQIIKNQFILLD